MSQPDTSDIQINAQTDIADLEDRGLRVIAALAGDDTVGEKTLRVLERLREEKKETFYADVMFYLTTERFPGPDAKALWGEIIKHKFYMSERLDRNVGVRVAALDYLVNIRKLLSQPRVIKSSDLRRTVQMARTDGLTGLYNRRYFVEQANRILDAAHRLKAPVILMMTDLDHFKGYNDTRGHQAGDLLLQEIARIARGNVRASDFVARYGGDEFALLLPRANKLDAIPTAEKIRQHVRDACQEAGVTISIGLAQFPEDATSRDDLVAAADEVLYRAKEFGGDKVCYFHPAVFRFSPKEERVQNVHVVGDFNNWSHDAHPLTPMSGGREWHAVVPLKPGRYRYKFLVNNTHWQIDPHAKEFESDGFGGQCAVRVVR